MKALVIFSGGQDSTTCLGMAIKEHDSVEAICFQYGQKHSVEIRQAKIICAKWNIPLHFVNVEFFSDLSVSALTSFENVNDKHSLFSNLPASYVPNRNMLFITLAHSLAIKIGAECIYMGVNQEDYSGYPDCREEFIKSITSTLYLSSKGIPIYTPLIHFKKHEIFKLADKLGILGVVIKESHTCYNGDHESWNSWGFGCGKCPACELRKKGYADFIKERDSQ